MPGESIAQLSVELSMAKLSLILSCLLMSPGFTVAEVSRMSKYLAELCQDAAKDASTLILIDMTKDEIAFLSSSSIPIILLERDPSVKALPTNTIKDAPGLLVIARVSTLDDVVRAQDALKSTITSKRFVFVISNMTDLASKISEHTDLVHQKSVVVETGRECGECILEHLVCPNQNFEFGHHIWHADRKAEKRSSSVFDWHSHCPNFFYGKTLNIGFVLASPIMMRRGDGSATGIDPTFYQDIFAPALGLKLNVSFARNRLEALQSIQSNRNHIGTMSSLVGPLPPKTSITSCLYTLTMVVMTRLPRQLDPFMNVLSPFDAKIWFSLFGTYLIAETVLFVSRKILRARRKERLDGFSFLVLFTMLCAQGVNIQQKNGRSVRTMLMFWAIFVLFIHSFYDSNLRGLLAKKSFEKPIEGMQDLYDAGQSYYVAKPFFTYAKMTMSNSENKAKRELFRGTMSDLDKYSYTFDKGMRPKILYDTLIKEGGGYTAPAVAARFNFRRMIELYGNIPFRIGKVPAEEGCMPYAINQYAPWKEDVDKVIGRIPDSGIFTYINTKFLGGINPPEKVDTEPMEVFRLEHLFFSWVILIMGLLVSTAAGSREIWVGRKERK